MKISKIVFCCVVISIAMATEAYGNRTVSYNSAAFDWPDKQGIPARDAKPAKTGKEAGEQVIKMVIQKGDTVWLRKAYTPILIYGDSEVQIESGVACVENYFDLELEDFGRRLVVCNQKEADFMGIVTATAGGVTTLRAITAGRVRELYAALHLSQTEVAVGDTLTFSGRQTYFYPDNKMKTLRVYKPDGTFDFSADYDQTGATINTMQTGDTIQHVEYFPTGNQRLSLKQIVASGKFLWNSFTPKGQKATQLEINTLNVTNSGLQFSAYVTPALPANGYADLVVGRLTHQNMIDWLSLNRLFQYKWLPANEPLFMPVWAQRYSRDEDRDKPSPLTQYLKNKTHWQQYVAGKDSPVKNGSYAFVVDKSSNIKDVRILQSSGLPEFDREIIKAIKEMPMCSKGGIWSRSLGKDNESLTAHDYEVRFYIVPTHEDKSSTSEPPRMITPAELSDVHVGDSLWLTTIFDGHEIPGDYSVEDVYGQKFNFRVAYTDLERTDQWDRLVVTDADRGHMLGIIEDVDLLGTTLRVYADVSRKQLHSVMHVNSWAMNVGDTLMPNGKQKYYYPSGQIKCEREFKESGIYMGEKTFDLSGRVISIQDRADSVLFREFYPSGALRQTYTYSKQKRSGRWRSYAEDGSMPDTLFCTRLVPYDDGLYIEYESTPSIPAGELPDSAVAHAEYTISEPVACMRSWRNNLLPMALYPLRKEGQWRDRKEKYLIPRAYFVKQTRWFDAVTPNDTIRPCSYSCIIDRDGRIQEVSIDRGSGIDSLDGEMVEAILNLPIYRPGAIVRRKVGSDIEERIPHAYKLRFYTYNGHSSGIPETMPQFPGGIYGLREYLEKNVKYPPSAQMNGIQGRAVCQFIVEKDGSVAEVTILRTSGNAALDAEALRVIRSMPKWLPGMRDGQPVRVLYTTPISFRLE